KVPVILWSSNNGRDHFLLDGRNRLDAMELVGLPTVYPNGIFRGFSGNLNCQSVTKDPCAYVISANIHRRHLTAEPKRDLIIAVLKGQPQKSNRQIAKETGTSHPHVAKIRQEAEKAGNVETITTSIDTKGRKQPAKRKPAEQKSFHWHMTDVASILRDNI